MNSLKRQILAILQEGALTASDILAALRLQAFKGQIEGVYLELVALEARECVRVEGIYDGAGHRTGGAWALGRAQANCAPRFESEPTSLADVLHIFGRPTEADQPTPPGVVIHECR